jgi:intein/homing endonuclease
MQHINNNVKIGNVVSNGKTFKRCRWSIVNKHLWLTLNNLGCVPNKSKILEFPFIFKNSNLTRHFIRGYFDGDGCISYAIINNKVQPRVSLLGTKSFLTTIKYILEK